MLKRCPLRPEPGTQLYLGKVPAFVRHADWGLKMFSHPTAIYVFMIYFLDLLDIYVWPPYLFWFAEMYYTMILRSRYSSKLASQ